MVHFLIESAAFLLGSGVLAALAYAQHTGKADREDPRYLASVGVVAVLTIVSAFV